MMKPDRYYSYEDICNDVDEIDSDSENDSIEDDYSEYSESLSHGSREEWLSTIAEETSFDLRTRKSLDSASLVSCFDFSIAEEDFNDDTDEEIDSLRGVQRQLERLKKRLDRFTSMSDEDDSLDSDCYSYSSEEEQLEPLEPPPMQQQRSSSNLSPNGSDSPEKPLVRKKSQSTQTTLENSSHSDSSSSSSAANSLNEDGEVALDVLCESERIDPLSISSSMKDTQVQLGIVTPKMVGIHSQAIKLSSSQHHRWIGTNIEFSIPTKGAVEDPADTVSLLDAASISAESIVSTSFDISSRHRSNSIKPNIPTSIREESRTLVTPLMMSPKRKVVLPSKLTLNSALLQKLDEGSDYSPTSSRWSEESSPTVASDDSPLKLLSTLPLLPPSSRSQKNIDFMVADKKISCHASSRLPPSVKGTTTTYLHVQSPAYCRRQQKRNQIQAKLQALQSKLSTIVKQEKYEQTNTKVMKC
ncbi:unnamed protein product [Cylindrotheca closterium]|uniref:Uncharacterized protein n=1 Tax=Cylindrotheca closterium TaxID=2856 RepID=A0AAD2JHN2_9STRA|nr:unnamed protein product [Cylindrotheca closterium]